MTPHDHEPDHISGEPIPGAGVLCAAAVAAVMWAVVIFFWFW